MFDFIRKYNLNGLYIVLILLVYSIYKNNYGYINVILNKILLLNHMSIIIIINIIGLLLLLNKLSFTLKIKWNISYR